MDRIHDTCTLEELGIDSLGLIRLRARLARRGVAQLQASDASPDTTVGKLLDALNGAFSAARSPLLWFRLDGADPAHVWIHPVGGGADCYRTLAKSLPNRFLAIESPRLRTDGSAAGSLAEIDERHVAHGAGTPLRR